MWENVTAIVILLRVLAKMRKCHLLSSDRERASPPSTEISVLTFVVKKSTMKLSECLFLENRKEKIKMKCQLELSVDLFS